MREPRLTLMERAVWDFLQARGEFEALGLTIYRSDLGQAVPFDPEALKISGPMPCIEGTLGKLRVQREASGRVIEADYRLRMFVQPGAQRAPRASIEDIWDTVYGLLVTRAAYESVLAGGAGIENFDLTGGQVLPIEDRNTRAIVLWIGEINMTLTSSPEAF